MYRYSGTEIPFASRNFGIVLNDFFHTNLRNARLRAGLTQTVLAEELGLGRTTIVSLENGKTRLFSKHIPRIAAYFGLSVEELLCGEDARTLLEQQPLWAERIQALKDEYNKRLDALQAELDRARRDLASKESSLRTLEETNSFLLKQLQKRRK